MVRKMIQYSYLLSTYIVLVVVMFALPYYSVENYSILRNTTSHLGAQNTSNAWVINVAFVLLGLASIKEGWMSLRGYGVHKVLLTIFGMSLLGVAFFQHAPIVEGIPYSMFEDTIHSVFAATVGFSFTLFAVCATFIETSLRRRVVALTMAVTAITLSLLIFNIAEYAGVWQRLMFVLSFAWLINFLQEVKARQD